MKAEDSVQPQLDAARAELLDLSFRNPLLHYRILKARGLEVVDDEANRVFSLLTLKNSGLSFLPRPEPQEPDAQRPSLPALPPPREIERVDSLPEAATDSRTSFEQSVDPPTPAAVTKKQEIGSKRVETQLQTPYMEPVLQARLLATYRSARTLMQEQGVNSLFFAFGLLEWFESDSSNMPRKAPLILVPVELERANVKERFKLSYTRDEIQGNWSLAAKLHEHGITLPLPEEADDLDLEAYFSQVENAIQSQPRWRVHKHDLSVGFFSFSKYLLYLDLDESLWHVSNKPSQHVVIRALLGDGFAPVDTVVDESINLDDQIDVEHVFHVLDTDSSQAKAILDVLDGKHLVIQGPPGTGKSQTIANLIAEALGQEKTVLFVAEKMAALDVVKRRLDAVGLGDACLELHSKNANKKNLLNELRRTLELGQPRPERNGTDLSLLTKLQQQLNTYAQAVNEPIGISGYTPHQAFGELLLLRANADQETLSSLTLHEIEAWTKADYQARLFLVEQLQEWCRTHGTPLDHPFWGCRITAVLPSQLRDLAKALPAALEATDELSRLATALTSRFDLPAAEDRHGVELAIRAARTILEAPKLAGVSLEAHEWVNEPKTIREMLEAGYQEAALREVHGHRLLSQAWSTDVEAIRRDLARYGTKWWRFLSGRYRRAVGAFRDLFREAPPTALAEQLTVLDALITSQQLSKVLKDRNKLGAELFGEQWRNGEPDWVSLRKLGDWIIQVHAAIGDHLLPDTILSLLRAQLDLGGVVESVRNLEASLATHKATVAAVVEALELDESARFGDGQCLINLPLAAQRELISRWRDQLEKLQDIVPLNHLALELEKNGLMSAFELAKGWYKVKDSLVAAFKHAWFEGLIERSFRERPDLAQFSGDSHEQVVEKFRELDRLIFQYNRLRLAQAHYARLPSASGQGQIGTLRREFEKRARHLPIRQLMLRAGNAIQRIKPVIMMSPLSIAQFIPPDSLKFDLVVFDEASQVRPAEAFGAILRGNQAVVVGDSRQLPPTNFFNVMIQPSEDDEETATSDIESVLGLFVAQGAYERMLRWHYRSRHESLITVSNKEFYDNRLFIFPSPDGGRLESGLVLHHLPDTVYDRGGSSTNPEEAKVVAQAVMQHARERAEFTLGVAAFSIKQMTAIEDQLELLRRQDPSCEAFFTAHPHEPFFVKNLETVQGDERDVIFLSLGHGRDVHGRVAMDFGPLNRVGGERRLNVLITRARVRCEVFTNLTAEDIDLSRTNAFGVRALKTFLRYAATGQLETSKETGGDADSPFEEAVYKALRDLGYDIRKQVGSAGYFIDLAVVDPARPGRYLLGIECDGASYHSSKSARDRDRLRQQVLEGLGWHLHRIWSTDWFRNPGREIKRAVAAIEAARALTPTLAVRKRSSKSTVTHAPPTGSAIAREDKGEWEERPEVLNSYQVAAPNARLGLEEELHMVSSSRLADWICEVVNVESPVHVDEVTRRILDSVGVKRGGSRIQGAIQIAIRLAKSQGRLVVKGNFLWLPSMDTPPLRDRSSLPATSRKIEYVAPEEIDAAILKAVRVAHGLLAADIPPVAARYLGFSRVSGSMRKHLEARVAYLLAQKQLERQGEHLI